MLPSEALLYPWVEEALAHVQGESLKADAALLVRLSNSPITRGENEMRYFIIGLFGIVLVSAHAKNVEYDFQKAILKEQLTHLEYETLSCFSDSFKAMLQQGVRIEPKDTPVCISNLRKYLP